MSMAGLESHNERLREEAKTNAQSAYLVKTSEDAASIMVPGPEVKGEAFAIGLIQSFLNPKIERMTVLGGDTAWSQLWELISWTGRTAEAEREISRYRVRLNAKIDDGTLTDEEYEHYNALGEMGAY
jgi:hypothetical protein